MHFKKKFSSSSGGSGGDVAQGPLGRGKSPSPPHSASLKRESSIREARRRARERVRLRVRNMTNEQFKDYAARIAIDDILVDYLYYLFMIKKKGVVL